ncbi:MAG: hypothetical protein JRI56_10905 [Deltaproteobacteria bacterium]|nr:hypothetical protein [Deltaproteobacteria bacterium]
MNLSDLYGAYVEYYHDSVFNYQTIFLGDWHSVMSELDGFVKCSTDNFIQSFWERINLQLEGELADYIQEYDYLNDDSDPSEVISLIVEKETANSNYKVGTPYTQRPHWQFLEWALDCVKSDEDSWFDIRCEGQLANFISKLHQHLNTSYRVYPQALDYSVRYPVNSEDYEFLGKLSLFLSIGEAEYPEAIKGLLSLVEDFNERHAG